MATEEKNGKDEKDNDRHTLDLKNSSDTQTKV
jgi:hypothetical protein